MNRPVQITIRDMRREPTFERLVLQKIAWLEKHGDRITGCRVLVEAPHRHRRNGRACNVRVDVTIPGSELVVRREAAQGGFPESVRVALRDAFDAARRILQETTQRRRGETKRHNAPGGTEVPREGAAARQRPADTAGP